MTTGVVCVVPALASGRYDLGEEPPDGGCVILYDSYCILYALPPHLRASPRVVVSSGRWLRNKQRRY